MSKKTLKNIKNIKKRKKTKKEKKRNGEGESTSLLSKVILYSIIVALNHFPRSEAIVAKKVSRETKKRMKNSKIRPKIQENHNFEAKINQKLHFS